MSSPSQVLIEPTHLVARFFRSLSARPPSMNAERFADDHLSDDERKLWVQLSNQDRRHSAGVARRFLEEHPAATRAEIAGALLHDVGKIECGLGTFRRTAATLVGPRTRRFRLYHDHEPIGARLAEQIGSDPVTIELIAGVGPLSDLLEECDY